MAESIWTRMVFRVSRAYRAAFLKAVRLIIKITPVDLLEKKGTSVEKVDTWQMAI